MSGSTDATSFSIAANSNGLSLGKSVQWYKYIFDLRGLAILMICNCINGWGYLVTNESFRQPAQRYPQSTALTLVARSPS